MEEKKGTEVLAGSGSRSPPPATLPGVSGDTATTRGGNVAILTSGGDSQGMNAAVRAVVRVSLHRGLSVYAVKEGYYGLIHSQLQPLSWYDVAGILQQGGTVLGTARCLEFREKEGMKKAVLNLIRHGITRLIVIGGDGSLTGASRLRDSWDTLVKELRSESLINSSEGNEPLVIAGLVGSIDNDMYGTDMTIGADTALLRIVEACDALNATAASHRRSFVVEVMGRHCGWLALTAAIATGADYVFFPEDPPDHEKWKENLCTRLSEGRMQGRRLSMVIVAEGAIDSAGHPITSTDVRKVLEELGHDTRTTILGHVQRGGKPSAYDRIMSTRLGTTAVDTVLSSAGATEDRLIGASGSSVILQPLMECVKMTQQVGKYIDAKEFKSAMNLRGAHFNESKKVFYTTSRPLPHLRTTPIRIVVLHAGAASPGMNTAVRAAVRLGIDKGFKMFTVQMGFEGLIAGQIKEVSWMTVNGWASLGGSLLGTSRKVPKGTEDARRMADALTQFGINGMIIIGGWEALEGVVKMEKHKTKYPILGLTKALIPATISNNMPATEYSIGSDTALNSIIQAVDKIKQSAVSYGRVFVVEVMGGNCGYLALMSAIGTGAELAYLPESGITLGRLMEDSQQLIKRFKASSNKDSRSVGLVILNEHANKTYNADFLCSVFSEEGKGVFSVRKAVLGHLQQGGEPSPRDRIRATAMATYAIEYFEREVLSKFQQQDAGDVADLSNIGGSVCIGETNGNTISTPFSFIPSFIDAKARRPLQQWWMDQNATFSLLSLPPPAVYETKKE